MFVFSLNGKIISIGHTIKNNLELFFQFCGATISSLRFTIYLFLNRSPLTNCRHIITLFKKTVFRQWNRILLGTSADHMPVLNVEVKPFLVSRQFRLDFILFRFNAWCALMNKIQIKVYLLCMYATLRQSVFRFCLAKWTWLGTGRFWQ